MMTFRSLLLGQILSFYIRGQRVGSQFAAMPRQPPLSGHGLLGCRLFCGTGIL
jgi:hypothetical protein